MNNNSNENTKKMVFSKREVVSVTRNNFHLRSLTQEESSNRKFVFAHDVNEKITINYGNDHITLGLVYNDNEELIDIKLIIVNGDNIDDNHPFDKKLLSKIYNNTSFSNKSIFEEIISFLEISEEEALKEGFTLKFTEIAQLSEEDQDSKYIKYIVSFVKYDGEEWDIPSVSITDIQSMINVVEEAEPTSFTEENVILDTEDSIAEDAKNALNADTDTIMGDVQPEPSIELPTATVEETVEEEVEKVVTESSSASNDDWQ